MDAPCVTRNGNVIYISNPLFTDYIKFGVRVYRDVVKKCIELLLEEPMIKTDLPVSAEVTLRKQEDRFIVHILHYIAERKSRKLDIIDTKIPLYNRRVMLYTGHPPKKVYMAPTGQELPIKFENGYMEVIIPEICGHVMVVAEM